MLLQCSQCSGMYRDGNGINKTVPRILLFPCLAPFRPVSPLPSTPCTMENIYSALYWGCRAGTDRAILRLFIAMYTFHTRRSAGCRVQSVRPITLRTDDGSSRSETSVILYIITATSQCELRCGPSAALAIEAAGRFDLLAPLRSVVFWPGGCSFKCGWGCCHYVYIHTQDSGAKKYPPNQSSMSWVVHE